MNINLVEGVWIVINLAAALLTVNALFDARADYATVKELNGKARELNASGNVRREATRALIQVLLLSLVIPGLFTDTPVTLSPFLVVFLAIPLLLLSSSFLDARDRKRLTMLVAADTLTTRADGIAHLEALIEENTEISRAASELASAAYREANAVNHKLEAQGRKILEGHEG